MKLVFRFNLFEKLGFQKLTLEFFFWIILFFLKCDDSNEAYASNKNQKIKIKYKFSMINSTFFSKEFLGIFFWKLMTRIGLIFGNLYFLTRKKDLPGSERVKPVSIIAKSFPFQTRLSTLCLGKHNSI